MVYANRFVVLFKAEGQYRKLFSVQFERRASGLGYYVHLPYFAHAQGLLANIVIEPGGGPTQIDFRATGTTTTERLKYSHHPDGRAHFSQDDKALTRVVTNTRPLSDHGDHLFTVNFWGVDTFELAAARDLKGPKPDRAPIRFDPAEEALPASQRAGRIVGTRYTVPQRGIKVDDAVASRGGIVEPVGFVRPDGTRGHGIPIFPTLHQKDEFFIMLTYKPMDRATGQDEASLTLIGGFHEPEGKDGPLTAIAIFYMDRDPAEWEELVRDRGTIDLPPELRRASRV